MEGPSTLMFALGCMAAVRKVRKETTDGCGFQIDSTPSDIPWVWGNPVYFLLGYVSTSRYYIWSSRTRR